MCARGDPKLEADWPHTHIFEEKRQFLKKLFQIFAVFVRTHEKSFFFAHRSKPVDGLAYHRSSGKQGALRNGNVFRNENRRPHSFMLSFQK